MAVAHVTEFEPWCREKVLAHYEAVARRVGLKAAPPEGLILHAVGFTDDGVFRVIDIWESEHAATRFDAERLTAVIASLEPQYTVSAATRSQVYALHSVRAAAMSSASG